MANRRGGDGGFEQPERENPFDAFERQDETMDEREDVFEDDPYEQLIDEGDEPGGLRGFLSTVQGKLLCIAVVLLIVILIGVVVWRFAFFKPKQDSAQLPGDVSANLPGEESAPSAVFGPTATDAPDDGPTSIVFMPEGDGEADEPDEPYGEGEPDADAAGPAGTPVIFSPVEPDEPEETVEPEETLPIVMTNTPTPSPTAAPTPSPSPSPGPTPTPTPSPTPIADIGTGKTNRDANLRAEMNAQSSVKKLVKRGETVTIHEAVMDAEGKLWYALTVDDISTDGWMRDYVVALDGPLAQPISFAPVGAGATAAPSLPDGVIGTGKTNRDANVRKIMNGKVVTQLRKNHKVNILAVKQDKAGDTWYQIRTESGTTGYVRDYVITLSAGTVLTGTQTTEAASGSESANPTAKLSLPTPGPAGTPTPKPTVIPTLAPAGAVAPTASPAANSASSGLSGTSSSLSGTSSSLSGTSSSLSDASSATNSTPSGLNGTSSALSDVSSVLNNVSSTLSGTSSGASGTSSGLSGTSSSLSGTSSGLSGTSSSLSGTSSGLSGTSSSLSGASSGLSGTSPYAAGTAYPSAASAVNPGMQAVQTVDPANRPSIGVAYTNRDANIREKPLANAKLVRQLAHGTELRVLGKYESEGKIWYEVVTTSGKTYGFARDYVLTIK